MQRGAANAPVRRGTCSKPGPRGLIDSLGTGSKVRVLVRSRSLIGRDMPTNAGLTCQGRVGRPEQDSRTAEDEGYRYVRLCVCVQPRDQRHGSIAESRGRESRNESWLYRRHEPRLPSGASAKEGVTNHELGEFGPVVGPDSAARVHTVPRPGAWCLRATVEVERASGAGTAMGADVLAVWSG